MSEFTYKVAAPVDKPSATAAAPVIYRVWPTAVIAFGLGLTAAWICLLGYGLVRIVELVI